MMHMSKLKMFGGLKKRQYEVLFDTRKMAN